MPNNRPLSPELRAIAQRLGEAASNGRFDRHMTRHLPMEPIFSVEAGEDLIGPLALQEALRLIERIGGRLAVEAPR